MMKKILIFAGTTEGRKLSEYFTGAKIEHTVCVATEYGEIVLNRNPYVKVHRGRMGKEQIEEFLRDSKYDVVIDATHPFAKEVTHNIKAALEKLNQVGTTILYLRLKREGIAGRNGITERNGIVARDDLTERDDMTAGEGGIKYFDTNEACARTLEDIEGNVLLTTGSKELSKYCVSEELKRRLYVRVLPSIESLSLCMEQGICGKQIIAMQGPFTMQMNEAVIRQYGISCLVTKESGVSGGYQEKIDAAKSAGIPVFVIGCPEKDEGYSFDEVCMKCEDIIGGDFLKENCVDKNHAEGNHVGGKHAEKNRIEENRAGGNYTEENLEIVLAGIGMGNINSMTKEVEKAINTADIIFGAERVLKAVTDNEIIANTSTANTEKHSFYQAEQIIPYLYTMQDKNPFTEKKKAVVLFSGDSGFYSGCKALYKALKTEIEKGSLKACVRVLPGISSVAYLASCVGESYSDAAIYSTHGKELKNLVHRIKSSPKTFLLTSGVKDINCLGEQLTEAGMTDCKIIIGYQLSYKEQRIEKHTPKECIELKEEGLYTCLIKNPYATPRRLTHGIKDEEFIREKVPMTKEEVREVSICKLRLCENAVVYDIGSGTGSIAIEIAGISDDLQVYAVERNKEATRLIEKNKEKFGLQNITVVEMEAPQGLDTLPTATHAFIGGSGGKLKEILTALRRINPKMRVVINAVSMETICEIKEILSSGMISEEEVVHLQVGRVKEMKGHHLIQSENPVWICAFNFCG
ncbi:MAG: precorrin-6A reductase [Clostridiales bacterium]|nr:precorrin-6A reductase [Clostridiales bacterium]